MSLVAAKNFLKFKEAIRRAYPEFTTTRDALTFSRDRQSMWFNNWSSISKFKFNVYFQIHVFGTMSVQLLFIVVYCAWTPTLDTFWDFSPPLGKKIGSRRRSGRRCKNAGDKAETKRIQHCNVTRREPELIVTTSNIEFWLSHFTQDILKHRRARQWSLSHWAKSYWLRIFEFEDPTSRRTTENFQPYRTFEDSARIFRHLLRVFNLPFPSKTRTLEIWSLIH
jgi:hypothetical protein